MVALNVLTFIIGFISGMYVVTQIEKGIDSNIKLKNNLENYESFVKKHYKKLLCVICGNEIKPLLDQKGKVIWAHGHNAEPVKIGRCCDQCNINKVLVKRMQSITKM